MFFSLVFFQGPTCIDGVLNVHRNMHIALRVITLPTWPSVVSVRLQHSKTLCCRFKSPNYIIFSYLPPLSNNTTPFPTIQPKPPEKDITRPSSNQIKHVGEPRSPTPPWKCSSLILPYPPSAPGKHLDRLECTPRAISLFC